MRQPALVCIVGPTASGKTQLAVERAQATDSVILSCDSLCFYRGMDIGTAKPTAEEQALVPHFGIDLVEPSEPYSVSRYVAYRDDLLEKMLAEGRNVVVVGGSGFYLKSFLYPVTDSLEIPEEISAAVNSLKQTEGLDGLLRELRNVNPPGEPFTGLDLNNSRRVEKALIRCLASGKGYQELRDAFDAMPEPLPEWSKEVWLIERPQEELQARNRMRVGRMLDAGLIQEVESLRQRGFEKNPSACGAIGYREVLQHLDGELSLQELEEAIYVHTNQLMRKQRTWFKNQMKVDKVVSG
ncbi:MAG: tRNA (adenosine(37)-N6)-dimethylallyltransferase MiaA [Puniceicoccaceae bacterium]